MANNSPETIPRKDISLLNKRPLMYFNFPAKQKVESYEYLLGSSKLPKYRPAFDEKTEEILVLNNKSAKTLLAESKKNISKPAAIKLQEIALIKAYKQMYETGATEPFMDAVKVIYGWPDQDLFWSILEEALDYAYHHVRNKAELKEVQGLINLRKAPEHPDAQVVHTRSKVFKSTQKIFKQAYSQEISLLKKEVSKKPWIHRYSQEEVIALFEALVRFYKLDKRGWVVVPSGRTERAMVNYEQKKISVAHGSFRLSRPRAMGWALHEVGVHAFSHSEITRYSNLLGERRVIEEGLGVFVEQMLFSRFQPVRSLRYIALGLALGIDGKKRNAKEVYEIIWRLRYLGGIAKSKKIAKEYAAKEVIRVFRGMPLNQKGVVITKDRAYIEGSQLIWRHIEEQGPELIIGKLLGKR